MKRILWLLLLVSTICPAQKSKKAQIKAQQKADKMVVASLQGHIGFLADDKLEGRRTGSAGEKLAYEYISKKFEEFNTQTVIESILHYTKNPARGEIVIVIEGKELTKIKPEKKYDNI